MRFKPGQEVTPVKKSNEWVNLTGSLMPFPEFGKIYTVKGYPALNYPEMVQLEEIEGKFVFYERNFEPVLPTQVIIDEIEAIIHE